MHLFYSIGYELPPSLPPPSLTPSVPPSPSSPLPPSLPPSVELTATSVFGDCSPGSVSTRRVQLQTTNVLPTTLVGGCAQTLILRRRIECLPSLAVYKRGFGSRKDRNRIIMLGVSIFVCFAMLGGVGKCDLQVGVEVPTLIVAKLQALCLTSYSHLILMLDISTRTFG